MNENWVAGTKTRGKSEHQQPLIGDVLDVLAHLDTGQSNHTFAQHVIREADLALHRLLEEEQSLDAAREAGEIEQELPFVIRRLDALEIADRVDPALAELRLLADRSDVVDRGKRPRPLFT
jgi:hypothetical protein